MKTLWSSAIGASFGNLSVYGNLRPSLNVGDDHIKELQMRGCSCFAISLATAATRFTTRRRVPNHARGNGLHVFDRCNERKEP